jgi:hypothetical protein
MINGEPNKNPTKHTPLTLVNNWQTIVKTIGENPLKGGFLVGSHLYSLELYFENKT